MQSFRDTLQTTVTDALVGEFLSEQQLNHELCVEMKYRWDSGCRCNRRFMRWRYGQASVSASILLRNQMDFRLMARHAAVDYRVVEASSRYPLQRGPY